MQNLSDVLLGLGAAGVLFFCIQLKRALKKITNSDGEIFSSISTLTKKTSELTQALDRVQSSSKSAQLNLADLILRAETASKNLELLLASLHDLPEPGKIKSATDIKESRQSSESFVFVRRS